MLAVDRFGQSTELEALSFNVKDVDNVLEQGSTAAATERDCDNYHRTVQVLIAVVIVLVLVGICSLAYACCCKRDERESSLAVQPDRHVSHENPAYEQGETSLA